MFELRCTVRNCGRPLSQKERGLSCQSNHHFDQSKEGYWSLVQPQDRKSVNPGDCEEAVLARQRWLQRGHMDGLVETLQHEISKHLDHGRTMDLGCGEGSFAQSLFSSRASQYCGIDLSKRALRLAARRWPEATWVFANADRTLPAMDDSVDRVVSLFGRRPTHEIARVLRSGGLCVVAVPGEDDLIELRQQAQETGKRRSRGDAIVEEMQDAGLRQQEQITWTHQVELSREAILDALRMTYRAVRRSQQSRIELVQSMQVTLHCDILLFCKQS